MRGGEAEGGKVFQGRGGGGSTATPWERRGLLTVF